MGRKKKLTVKEIAKELEDLGGGVYLVAQRLGVSHTTIYNYIDKSPTLREIKERLDNVWTDIAENRKNNAIKNGEPWAVKFQLATKGRDRGYSYRQEVEHSGEVNNKIFHYTNIDIENDI